MDKGIVTSGSQLTRSSRLRFAVALALIVELLLCPTLWTGQGRTFPIVPLWPLAATVPIAAGNILFDLMLAFLGAAGLSSKPSWFTTGFLILAAFLCLSDYTRCQTWLYQLSFMLALLSYWRREDQVEGALDCCRIVVASAYFWSGFWKLNARFFSETFSWFVQPLLPGIYGSTAEMLALPVPFIEMGASLALFFRRTRLPAIVFCIAMHIFILACIGPIGHKVNQIVWPWNIFMVAFVILLFWGEESETPARLLKWQGASMQTLTIALFAVAPLFNIWGLWDSNPSFFLYSGNQCAGFIYMSADSYQKLSPSVQKLCSRQDSGKYLLILNAWSLADLNVVTYPEPRVLRQIAKAIWLETNRPSDMEFLLEGRVDSKGMASRELSNCSAL